jgi:hypothetical protein
VEGPLTPPAALTVLYTTGLRGDIELLPRLFTFLRDLRARAEGSQVLLVDLGGSCAPEVWHCAVTGGRSMLIALDGMGYHAANVEGQLTPALRAKMGELTQMALVDAAHPYAHSAAVQVTVNETPASAPLTVRLDPAAETTFDGRALRLGRVGQGEIGRARLRGGALEADVHGLPRAAAPDPTIAGIVDFILSEARYTQKRGRG